MTSGTFHLVPLDRVTVKRDARQRRELTNIDVLADSINRLGLIHPIVVTRDLELVAGERRYTACISLGWTAIPAQYVDELDPAKLEAIELEENVKRQDITWQDQVNAVARYHRLRSAENSDWLQSDTAAAIGLSRQHTNRLLLVAEEMEGGNKLIPDAPKLSTAVGIAERSRERRDEATLERLHTHFEAPQEAPQQSIFNVDFTTWALAEWEVTRVAPPPRFNLIHCDFPYGIDADQFNQSSASAFGGYEDSPEAWERLIMALEITTNTLTAPSCHLMFWFAMRKAQERLYENTARALERIGWWVNPMPLIWAKSDGSGILPDPERGPRQIYETALLCSKGDRKIVRAKNNLYSCPIDSRFHMSTKPEPMLRHFFEMLVDENTVLLDPTCGSGSALRAAESLGARYVLGLELNPDWARQAADELEKFRRLRRATA